MRPVVAGAADVSHVHDAGTLQLGILAVKFLPFRASYEICRCKSTEMTPFARTFAAFLAISALSGCAGGKGNNSLIKVFGGGSSSSSSSSNAQVQPIRLLPADEIRSTIAGKTFQYTRGDSTGLITFNADGTSSVQDDVKGSGSGTWQANDGELCETLDDGASQCGPFKSTGDAYFAGKTRFVEMKVN